MYRYWLRAAMFSLTLGAASGFAATASAQSLALMGGSVYASPDAAPMADAVVLVSDGVITAVGSRSSVQLPPSVPVVDCAGKTVVAGFWNSHVHLTEPIWKTAPDGPAAPLTAHMQTMLTGWGFTTAFDLGSNPAETLPLRRRINSGEIAGPNIFLLGGMFPRDGHPVYLPAEMRLPLIGDPEEAKKLAQRMLDAGLDGVKLFTGSFKGEGKPVVNMDVAVAKAAVGVAHGAGKPVFAHPQNKVGVDTVIEAGVDVMAHTAPGDPALKGGYTPEELARFKQQNIALIPTLALFAKLPIPAPIAERVANNAVAQLKAFADNGGVVLFGTDVGFTNLYDTTLEFELMHRAISAQDVLASLTTNPARYFKAAKKGKVETGFDGDLVVLDGDPIVDVKNLARVVYTFRAGKEIYRKP